MNKLLFILLVYKTFGFKINLNLKDYLYNKYHLKNQFDNQLLSLKKDHINFNNYNGIIFEGGGTKGFYYPGIIRYLEEQKNLSQVQYLGGTSIGAIIASLIAVDYNSYEIETILKNGYELLKSKKFTSFKDFYRLLTSFGLIDGQIFQDYFDQLIEDKVGLKNCTLQQLKELTNKT